MTIAVQIEQLAGLQQKITIEMPWDEINNMAEEEITKLKSTVRINGFRPGKIPEKIIRERFGKAVHQDSMLKVMDDRLKQAFKDEDLRVITISKIEPEQTDTSAPFKFSAWFEILPKIDFKDFTGHVITKQVATIADTDVDEVLTELQQKYKEWIEVDREANLDDKIIIDFVGYRDGEPFAGGSATNQELILGSKKFIPGFEDGLLASRAGDKKTLAITFPEQYHEASLAGVATTFEVTVHKVLAGKVRPIDDEFASSLQVTGGVEALRQELRSGLERELSFALRATNKQRVFAKLKELNVFAVPESLIQAEVDRIAQIIEQQAKQKHNTVHIDKQQLIPRARDNVILGLMMREVTKHFSLKVEASHVRELLSEKMSAYENPVEMMRMYYNNEEMVEQINAEAMEILMVDALLNTAEVVEEIVPYKEAIRGTSTSHEHHDHEHHDHEHHEHHDHEHHDHEHHEHHDHEHHGHDHHGTN